MMQVCERGHATGFRNCPMCPQDKRPNARPFEGTSTAANRRRYERLRGHPLRILKDAGKLKDSRGKEYRFAADGSLRRAGIAA